MTDRDNAYVSEVIVGESSKHVGVDIVLGKSLGVVAKALLNELA